MKPTSPPPASASPPPPSPELREAEVAALLPRGVNAGEAFSLPRRAPCRGGPNPQKRLNPAQNPFTNTTLSSTLKVLLRELRKAEEAGALLPRGVNAGEAFSMPRAAPWGMRTPHDACVYQLQTRQWRVSVERSSILWPQLAGI